MFQDYSQCLTTFSSFVTGKKKDPMPWFESTAFIVKNRNYVVMCNDRGNDINTSHGDSGINIIVKLLNDHGYKTCGNKSPACPAEYTGRAAKMYPLWVFTEWTSSTSVQSSNMHSLCNEAKAAKV